eukprot:854964-Pyramimonas_sp.AAC.1
MTAEEAQQAAARDRQACADQRRAGLGRWRSAYPATTTVCDDGLIWEAAEVFALYDEDEAKELLR